MSALALAAKQRATRSPLLTRWLFGIRTPVLEAGNRYFDLTTLALKSSAGQRIPRGSRVLDMGTGTSAVLGLWVHRALGCEAVCCDVDPRTVKRALENVERNEARLEVHCGSLFDGVPATERPFDFVLFNPPYLRTATGVERRQPESMRSMWDGGADGTETIAAFLSAYAKHATSATVLLGINRLHVERARVTELVEAQAGVALTEVDAHRVLPVDVYVLVKT